MAFDYNSFLDEVKTVLTSNCTTTALALSLTTNYPLHADNIKIGNPERLPVDLDNYPAIILNLKEKNESYATLGLPTTGNRRDIDLTVSINGFVYDADSSDGSDALARTLARNIETALRTNTKGTLWDSCLVQTAVFEPAYREPNSEDTYLSSVKLDVLFKKYSFF